jgi:hypothetical protein
MDSANASQPLTCAAAEDALVQSTYESLHSVVARQLQQHLEQCDECRAFAATLTTVQSTIAEAPETLTAPAFSLVAAAPAVAATAVSVPAIPDLLQPIRAAFETLRNIAPIYQLAGAVAVILLVVVSSGNIQLQQQSRPLYPAAIDSMDTGSSPDSSLDTLNQQPRRGTVNGVGAIIDLSTRNFI